MKMSAVIMIGIWVAVCAAAVPARLSGQAVKVTIEIWGDAYPVLRDRIGGVDSVDTSGARVRRLAHCEREYAEPDENNGNRGVVTFTLRAAPHWPLVISMRNATDTLQYVIVRQINRSNACKGSLGIRNVSKDLIKVQLDHRVEKSGKCRITLVRV